jgi:hypothetical protein
MLQSVQGHGLPAAHLQFRLLEKFSFFDSQRIVRIHQSLRFDHEKALAPFNGNKIARTDMEVLGDLFGDHDLPALPDTADNGSGFPCHVFRLSDCQKPRYRIFTARAASSATVVSEISDCTIISTFAHRDSTGESVGEKAVLVLKARNK